MDAPGANNPTQANLPQATVRYAPGLTLSTAEMELLAQAFAGSPQIFIEREFRSGYSGAVVLLASPDPGQAQVVIKLGPPADLQREYDAYHKFVKKTAPQNTARLQNKPIQNDDGQLALLCYTFAGGDSRLLTRSLQAYYDSRGGQATAEVLDRVFRVYGRRWWAINHPQKFVLSEYYDRLLPVQLKLKPAGPGVLTTQTLVAGQTSAAALRGLEVGCSLQLQNFRIDEVRPDRRELTLTAQPPPGEASAPLRLRLELDAPVTNQPGDILAVVEAMVTASRRTLLAGLARATLSTFNPDAPNFTVAGRTLPNPLFDLADLLDRVVEARFSTIHGDLNLQNILVDEATGFAWLIDFAETRRGPTLFDVQRLEVQIITKLLPPALAQAELESTVVASLLESLHADPLPATTAHSALQEAYTVLLSLRRLARQYLMDDRDWDEYYLGLVVALIGSLKYTDLTLSARRLALISAAIVRGLVGQPVATGPSTVPSMHRPAVPNRTPPNRVSRPATGSSDTSSRWLRWLTLFGGGWFKPKPKAKTPLALVINVQGRVEVRRKDDDRICPAAFGMPLFFEDAVITYDASTTDIVCNNGYLYHLDWQSSLVVRCGEGSDQLPIGQLPHDLSQRTTRPNVSLAILSPSDLKATEQTIRNLPLDPPAQNFLLTRLYQSTALPEKAVAGLENLSRLGGFGPELAQELGGAYFKLGHLDQAQSYLQFALTQAHISGDPLTQAEARVGLGDVARAKRERTTAEAHWRIAGDLYRQSGYLAKAESIAALLPPVMHKADRNQIGQFSRWLKQILTAKEDLSKPVNYWRLALVCIAVVLLALMVIGTSFLLNESTQRSREIAAAQTSIWSTIATSTPIHNTGSDSINFPTVEPTAEGILTSYLPVYSGPDRSFAEVANIRKGTQVEITARNESGEWYKIIWPGGSGWVDADFVAIEEAVDLPVINPPATLSPIGSPTPGEDVPRQSARETNGYKKLSQSIGFRSINSESFSPDGSEIAITEGAKLYVIGVDGSHGDIFLGEDEDIRPVEGIVWSPNGALIAFVADRKWYCMSHCRRVGILVRHDKTLEPSYLDPPEGFSMGLPRWTQDGKLLVNIFKDDPASGTVYLYDPSGRGQVASGEIVLSSSHEGQKWSPWLPGKTWRVDQSQPNSYYND